MDPITIDPKLKPDARLRRYSTLADLLYLLKYREIPMTRADCAYSYKNMYSYKSGEKTIRAVMNDFTRAERHSDLSLIPLSVEAASYHIWDLSQGEHESHALWRFDQPSAPIVALETSPKLITRALPDSLSQSFELRPVEYVDAGPYTIASMFSLNDQKSNSSWICVRDSGYEFESGVFLTVPLGSATVDDSDSRTDIRIVPVDTSVLVERVLVRPNVAEFVFRTIFAEIQRQEPEIEVLRSSLDAATETS
ncbi:MAG: hypothetical protein J5I53_08920 [Bradyrhizobiaceae bacterium]|nr:hypothetical protein [Bradyrhizobiaceae bacterium]